MSNIAQSAWFEKHRPDNISDIVFPSIEYENLAKRWINDDRIDGNILLSGAAGTGKTTLSQVLIRSLIKTQSDLYRMKSRSVKEIDELQSWISKKPSRSKHNIVYIEEMDKLSREAQTTLKDGMMEKYIDTCVFICCTNHPKKIDNALLTRFTYKLHFDSNNKEAIKKRISDILIKENAKFNPQELDGFIETNYKKGLRDIINSLQISFVSNNGSVIFKDVEESLNIEEIVVKNILEIFQLVVKERDAGQRKLCLTLPMNSIIANQWNEVYTIVYNNFDLNYDDIFTKMIDGTNYIPIKSIIAKYADEVDYKKFPHIHLVSCIHDSLKCLFEALL